jgi:predicted PurR-regulated permease PerM
MRTGSAPRSDIFPRPETAADFPERPETAASAEGSAPAATAERPAAITRPLTPDAAAPSHPGRRPLSTRARVWTVVVAVVVALIFLFAVRGVIHPFIWAAVVSYVLTPVVAATQRRLRLPHGVAVSAIMLVLIGLLAWTVKISIPILQSDFAALNSSLSTLGDYLSSTLPNAGTTNILGVPVQVTAMVRSAGNALGDVPNLIFHNGISVASGAVGVVLHFLTFLITTFYLLLDGPRLGRWLKARLPAGARDEATTLGAEVNAVLSEYLRAEVILILIMGVASLVALTILGVHFALILAPIVGFLEILPVIGPFFAIVLVTTVAGVGPPNFGMSHVSFAVTVAAVFFVMRQLEDYLVVPKVIGHAVKLHPVIILFALLSGAYIAGVLGMLLAVPVMGALRILGRYTYDRLVE